ncbi:MAG: ribokinase [Chloroflexi bacterium]|nr:ribokinase [Chloroflexota bacterium]
MRRVIVVGSCNVDYTVETERLPTPGATVLGAAFRSALGGKGANQAVAAARLGAQVRMAARVGADAAGEALLSALLRAGVATSAVARDPRTPTGVALIVVDRAGQNLIAVAPGANGRLSARDVAPALADLAPADIVLAQLEVPIAAVLAAFRAARRSGAATLLNAAPALPASALAVLLRLTTVLVVNEDEAAALAGVPIEGWSTARAAAGALLGLGPALVVVTLGAKGALAVTATEEIAQPAFAVHSVDATGAGDAFCGALATWYGRAPLAEALALAAAAGALATTRRGAQPSLPTARAVRRLARRGGHHARA